LERAFAVCTVRIEEHDLAAVTAWTNVEHDSNNG
jgi:hypothetical protein